MRLSLSGFAIVAVLSATATPALAARSPQSAPSATPVVQPVEAPKPITDRPVTATDVVTTPVTDLNLKKAEIPTFLVEAQSQPYSLAGLTTCGRIASAIEQLDAALGDDLDVPQAGNSGISAGSVAKSVVAAFIPFRGVIRELSGANAQDRKVQAAVYAGAARRGFLKGIGQQRGCKYPARPAPPSVVAARASALAASTDTKAEKTAAQPTPHAKKRAKRSKYVSRPIVQKVN